MNLLAEVSIKVLNRILQYSGVDHGKAAPVLLHVLILDVFVPQWRGQKISSNVNHSSFKKAAEAKEKKELSYTLIDTQTRPINKDAKFYGEKKDSLFECRILPNTAFTFLVKAYRGQNRVVRGYLKPKTG